MPEITPERWPDVEALLDRALDLPPDERTAFLEAARADDPDLLGEVREVLRAGDRARSLLEDSGLLLRWQRQLPPLGDEPGDESDEEDLSGTVVGYYRLLDVLGRGGMGTVYRAERADGAFERDVALKLVRRGAGSAAVLRRFRHERQVLAGLDHPNVARLLDGGRSDDGRPYFVMELVEGEPITDYCDARGLGVEARLRLFGQVCQAVAFAHRNLVVHRDLKPSNILVTEDAEGQPAVKLLDFGIAKLLAPEAEAALTQTGSLILTPAYAAPEQLRGEAVTTATDVYALGLLLYELLAGQPPYRLDSAHPAEWLRVIAEVQPQLPSAVLRPKAADARGLPVGRLKKRLAGDLDTICLKALRKEPERRYPSAQALGEDIERHLAGWPVTARRDTVAYRARTFVRRHRGAVLATAAAVVAFLALAGFHTWQLAAERDRAQQEAETAEQVTAFLAGVFEGADAFEGGGQDVTASDLLERGVEQVEALDDQPEVQARLLRVLGNTYSSLGRYDEAQPLLERALAQRRTLWGDEHESVAQSANELALLLVQQGDYPAAESLLREALAVQRRLLGEDDPEVAHTLNNLAGVLLYDGDYAEAELLFREVLARRQALHGGDHREVALSLNNLAAALEDGGRDAQAEPLLREALAMWQRLLGEQHPYIAGTMDNLAGMLGDLSRYDEAEPLARDALTMWRGLLGDTHPGVAVSLHNLAGVLAHRERYAEAEQLYREALAMRRTLFGDEHPEVATSLSGLAGVLADREAYAEAESLERDALAMRQRLLDPDHLYIAFSRRDLAFRLMDLDRFEEAVPLLRQALPVIEETMGEEAPAAAQAHLFLGKSLTALGRYGEAEPHLQTAHGVLRNGGSAVIQDLHDDAREALAALYTAWGKPEQAARYR